MLAMRRMALALAFVAAFALGKYWARAAMSLSLGLALFLALGFLYMLVGVVRGITIHFAPAAGEASIYVLMFLVLLVRPRGLLGERIEKFE